MSFLLSLRFRSLLCSAVVAIGLLVTSSCDDGADDAHDASVDAHDATTDAPLSCPGQQPSTPPCCIADHSCVRSGTTSLGNSIVEVALDDLCGTDGSCPPDLTAALADAYCSSATRLCGRVTVTSWRPGSVFVWPSYDVESGLVVEATASTNELITRNVGGCCGEAFHGGTPAAPCDEVPVDVACTAAAAR